MAATDSYYSLLGVAASASESDIRDAYKKLAMRLHPDKGGEKGKWQNIQTAYDTLSDDDRRKRYDTQHTGSDSTGGVEQDFAHNFRGGDYTGARAGPPAGAGAAGDGFGGALAWRC